ncbi:MAG: bifunctional phosphoribosylaminoimidazolecarboxamide formyltransferase/IMP cyclohydrolase, partial [Dehalococcoidia bacterium]
RAAAKNHPFVLVVVDPADYGWVGERLGKGSLTLEERRHLAAKAFRHVALYDSAIAQFLSQDEGEALPQELLLAYRKLRDLRYGENPHQPGALYVPTLGGGGIAQAVQLHGKELSFNNLLDAEAAWHAVQEFPEPTVAVIKHTNPCGLACHHDQTEAYRRALAGDPVSAFGGIVGFNRPVTPESAREMSEVFYEVVVAPSYEPQALELLKKKRNLRVLEVPQTEEERGLDLRPIGGGLLVQRWDALDEEPSTWRTVTAREPTAEERRDLAFAWRAVKLVKSNAIVLARDRALVGMGAGQPNRVTSVHLALRAAGERARGCVLASDAFFPFPDGVELAAQGGVTAIVQPGGSIRDQEVIQTAEQHGIAMLFTGVRHFRH